VLFRLGDTAYRQSDFMAFVPYMLPPDYVEAIKSNPRAMEQFQSQFPDWMLVLALAEREGLEKTPAFQEKIANATKSLLIREMGSKKVVEVDAALPPPTDEQLRAYYEQNLASFRTGEEKATARHILAAAVGVEGEADARAMARLDAARAELLAGKGWDEVAKEYSDDPGSKDSGGLYKNFSPAQMVAEFAEAVRTQEIGAIGPPVKTQFGYHMIMVEARSPGHQTFEEAKDRVRAQVMNKMRMDAFAAFIGSLKAEFGYSEGDAPPPVAAGGR